MASEHLIKITNKAKQLRRANPKLKWTDAVKKASKLIKPATKKAAPKKRVAKKVSGVKKSAPKKAATKTHKDTKSYNVNIRVMSGTNTDQLSKYSKLCKEEKDLVYAIEQYEIKLKNALNEKTKSDISALIKKRLPKLIRRLKIELVGVKQQKAIQKKLI